MIQSTNGSVAAFETMLRDACSLLRPPDKLTLAAWADKYGMLSSESSANPGKYLISNAEYQREPMTVLSDPLFQTVVMMWASQVGKTQIMLFWIAFTAHHDPCPMLIVEPTLEMAESISNERITPMIRDTPVLRPLFGNVRTRDSGNKTLSKSFPGGQVNLAGANSPASLASRPVRRVATDEEGRYPPSAGKEGSPVAIVKKRMATFNNRQHLRISTPNMRKTCEITKAYENSDKRRYYVPCPQCGHFQTLRWDQLHWPPGDPTGCYYVCEQNACVIYDHDKYAMVRRGVWRADNPGGGDGRTAGFHLSALYSTIGFSWTEIINQYLQAKDTPAEYQTFVNTILAEPWDEEQAEGADKGTVERRAEIYPAQAPAGVIIITCGADVQKDRIEATKWGWGLENQSWVIEHRIFRGDPTAPEVWQLFEEWRQIDVEHETGLQLPVACTFVDSGDGNRTQAVYEFCRRKERQRVYATKGSSLPGSPLAGSGKRVGRYKTILVVAGASTAKDTIYSRLQITDPTAPGYIHTPKGEETGCISEFYAQLTAESLVTRQFPTGDRTVWEKPAGRRNEALDCAVYALAAKEFTKAPLKQLWAKMQRKAATLPKKQKPDVETWAQGVAESTMRLKEVLTTPGKLAEIVNKSASKTHAKPRKRIKRPGFAWIHG